MRQANRWLFIGALIIVVALGGCDTSRPSMRSSLFENGHFMDLWSVYTHCYRSEDIDVMREDARRLSRAANTIDSAEPGIFPEDPDSTRIGPPVRLSVDPAGMAASCALHAGQVAQAMGRVYDAREMFYMIVINFPQPRYQYYVAHARQALARLDAASRADFSVPPYQEVAT